MVKWLDIEMGLLGAAGMGFSIFLINLTGGVEKAFIAAVWQALYSFLVITFTTKTCREVCKRSEFWGVFLPSTITTVLTYAMHWFAKSPEPFWSAAFAFIIAVPSFIIMTYRFRKTNLSVYQLIRKLFS